MSEKTWPARVRKLVLRLGPELAIAEAQGLGARLVDVPLDPLLRPLLPIMESLEDALRTASTAHPSLAAASAAATALLGAGFGLTPSGDDFLAGLLGTLRVAKFEPRELLDSVIAVVNRAAPERTTSVSATLLLGALSTEPPPVLAGFWSALFSAEPADVHEAVTRLRAHGTTSPWDFLCGVAAAARVQSDRENLPQ